MSFLRKLPCARRRDATSSSSSSCVAALVRASISDPPVLYLFQELNAATNNFLAQRAGGATSIAYRRCSLRGHDATLFQLQRRPGAAAVDATALARIGRYSHISLARLLGVCPTDAHLYLAYELPPGAATLAACLHNTLNPSFTALRTWVSRVQVVDDVAKGLEYVHHLAGVVHHDAGAIHGRVSSSTVIVTNPGLRAQLTHFGVAEFTAPADVCEVEDSPYVDHGSSELSHEADVYAFGVLLLELLSGEEPVRDRFHRVSVLETAAVAAAAEGGVRKWVDRRLGDSFLVPGAESLVEVALCCCAAGKDHRPDMRYVAFKVSTVYLASLEWEQNLRLPTEISVSVAPL